VISSADLNELRTAIEANIHARHASAGYWSADGRCFTSTGLGYQQDDLHAQVERELLTAVSLEQTAADIRADAGRILDAHFAQGDRKRYSMLRLGKIMLWRVTA
jgi:hypothetical protein